MERIELRIVLARRLAAIFPNELREHGISFDFEAAGRASKPLLIVARGVRVAGVIPSVHYVAGLFH